MQQLTCKIDLSNYFYYLFFSFVLIELKPLVLREKSWGKNSEKVLKSAKKCENYETILPFSCCPLVFPWSCLRGWEDYQINSRRHVCGSRQGILGPRMPFPKWAASRLSERFFSEGEGFLANLMYICCTNEHDNPYSPTWSWRFTPKEAPSHFIADTNRRL